MNSYSQRAHRFSILFKPGQGQKTCHLPVICFCILLLLVSASAAICGENQQLVYLSGQTTFFADKEYTIEWDKGKNFWNKVDSLQVRMVSANKTVFLQTHPAAMPIRIKFHYPEIRPGVVMESAITITASFKGRIQENIYSKKIFFYSQQHPFIKANLFAKKDVAFLDLANQQTSERLLTHFKLPATLFTSTSNLPGKWLICSGVDFQKQTGLISEFNRMLQKGISILVLTPLAGKFILPPFTSGSRLVLADHDIFAKFGKRINLQTASPVLSGPETTFKIASHGNQPGIVAQPGLNGFGWMELKTQKSRIIFCGWNLPAISAQNPSAGILLNCLLRDH